MGDLGGVMGVDNQVEPLSQDELEKKYGKQAVAAMTQRRHRAARYSTSEFDVFSRFEDGKYCVLFLDEFNRANGSIRGSLLTLICNHTISDNEANDGIVEQGKRFLPALLFTVAAINPGEYDAFTEPLTAPERARFKMIAMEARPEDVRKFFIDEFSKSQKKEERLKRFRRAAAYARKIALVDRLLSSPAFTFASPEDEEQSQEANGGTGTGFLNPRSLKMLFDALQTGTKAEFLEQYPKYCGTTQLQMVRDILAGYKDVDVDDILSKKGTGTTKDTKANDVFKKNSEAQSVLGDLLKDL